MSPVTRYSLLFGAASLIVITISWLKLPISTLQQVIGLIVILLLLLINQVVDRRSNSPLLIYIRYTFIFLSSVLTQLIVVSTGGLFSPFLILLHLATLSLGLFLGFSSAVIFLALALLALAVNALLTPAIWLNAIQDLGTVLLYVASFIAIVPLMQLLARQYHSKEALSQALSRQIDVEESILGSVNDMVFITDLKLRIISINEAVERLLHQSSAELLRRPLFDALFLKDAQGHLATPTSLSLDRVTIEQSERIITNLQLATKNTLQSKPVTIHVQPNKGLNGRINSLSFIVVNAAESTTQQPSAISLAVAKHQATIHTLEQKLANQPSMQLQLYLLDQAEQDIMVSNDLRDQSLDLQPTLLDIAQLLRQLVNAVMPLTKALHTTVTFELPDLDKTQIAPLIPSDTSVSPDQLTSAFYTIPADNRWTEFLLNKLITLAVLLTSSSAASSCRLTLTRPSPDHLSLHTYIPISSKLQNPDQDLFTPQYGRLVTTNLQLGSGLEGYLVQTVATQLNIPLEVHQQGDELVVDLSFSQKPPSIHK